MRNRRKSSNLAWIGAILLALAVLGGVGYANYRYAIQNPGGTDFLVHWVGTKSLIEDGISPYSDETALQIQEMVYGRPAVAGEHELRVAYPLYSIIIFLPFAFVDDFNIARAAWMTLLEISLVLMSLLCLRIMRWRPGLVVLAVFFLFSITWYHAVRPLINGNAVILVALMLTGVILAIRARHEELAGVLLAFSTIKPQVVILITVYILIWAIARRRWKIVGWFFATLAILSASVALLVPDWILQNIREVLRYPGYNPPGTPGAAFAEWLPGIGQRLGYALSAMVGLILLTEWFIHRKAENRAFLWTVSLTLVLSQWSGIQTDPGNFIVVFPALVLLMKGLQDRWSAGGGWVNVILMLVLLVGLWGIFLVTLGPGDSPQQSSVMFFPLISVLLLGLYWIRWWATHPPATWIDQFEEP